MLSSFAQLPLVPEMAPRASACLSKWMLYLLFAAAIGLPMVINFFRLSSSVSLGTALAGLLFLVIQLTRGAPRRMIRQVVMVTVAASAFAALHLFIAAQLWPVDLLRGFGSIPMLATCIGGGIALGNLLLQAHPEQLTAVIRHFTQILLILGIWGGLGLPEPQSWGWNKPIFPFTEPSHLAITIAPYLIFTCVTSHTTARFLYIAAALLMTALLESTILAVIVLLLIPLSLRLRYAVAAVFLLALIIATVDLTYYLSRIDFSINTENLSALVYKQGWQLMDAAWESSNSFGIGFQQLGVVNPDVPASRLIAFIFGDAGASLNLFDGGFTLAKTLSEFGLFGAVMLIPLAVLTIRAGVQLHRESKSTRFNKRVIIMAYSFLLGFFSELVLRGIGYFTPTSLLMISSLWVIWQQRRPRK